MSNGVYKPGKFVAHTTPFLYTSGPPVSGHGTPEDSVDGVPGDRYTDIDTGELYRKMTGNRKTGWVKVGTVGQAGVSVIG